jgi:hypothetical protein
MITEVTPKLFRYDLDEPPSNWSTSFYNNEGNYNDPILGHKNKAGLFFFIDSIVTANELGKIASRRENKDKYFLTTLDEFVSPVKLIDFSNNDNIYFMLCNLVDNGIDVLTDKFKTYNKFQKENDFGEFKSIFSLAETAASEREINKWRGLLDQLKIGTSSSEDVGLFGQRLTDFDNGLIFKSLVKSLHPDIDGYRWKENQSGFTYCLFESRTLPNKKSETVLL